MLNESSMKKTVLTIILFLTNIFITLLFSGVIRNNFSVNREKMQSDAIVAFDKAISEEERIVLNKVKVHSFYKSGLSSDNLSLEDKENWCDQSYLIFIDSNRIFLDSLFQVELVKRNLSVRSAVACVLNGKMTRSSADSLFYKEAIALDPLVYRLNEKPEGRMELQAYVELPFLFVLRQTPSLGWLSLLWLLSIGGIWAVFWFWLKRKQAVSIVKEVVHTEIVEQTKVVFVSTMAKKGALPYGIQFDEESGMLNYQDKCVTLTNNGLKIFTTFLTRKKSLLTHADILQFVFQRKEDDPSLKKSNKDMISVAINRLRKELQGFPFIEIQACRGVGYQLIINDPATIRKSD